MHALQFYVVNVLPRLLPTVANSERCALAQAGPFNSHTLAEQALNQPGREVGACYQIKPSGGLGSYLAPPSAA